MKQYYDILAKKPEELHRFYANESTFTHAEDPREEVELVQTGVDAIKKRVSELNYLNAHVDLSEGFLDVQKSISSAESILVVVTGHFSLREIKSRPFTHSFVLAVPTSANMGRPGSYYVHNSVFRLISGRSMPTASKAVEASPEMADATTSSSGSGSGSSEQKSSKSLEASKGASSAAPEKGAKAEAEAEADAAADKVKLEAKAKDDADAAAAAAAEAEAAASAVPKSYADMAKKISAVPPPAPSVAARVVKKSSDTDKKESNNSSSKGEAKDSKKGGDKGPGGDSHASMYVRNLTPEVTEADLRGLFESYGDITGVDISNGKGFAFIDFGSRAAMVGVLGAKSPFTLHGNQLKVEERSSKGTTKSSSGSGSGSGSGGKQEKDGGGSGGGSGGRRGGDGRKGGSSSDSAQAKGGDAKKGGDGNGEGKKRSGGGSGSSGSGSGSGGGSSGVKKGQQQGTKDSKQK